MSILAPVEMQRIKRNTMNRRRIKMIVQFDGAGFYGWQRQPGGMPTVQGVLETALAELAGSPVKVYSAGRTDTGVHALAMPVHIDLGLPIPTERLPVALNKFLPPQVAVLSAEDAPDRFDARRSARLRWYRYQILNTRHRRPLGPRAWHVFRPLDVAAMKAGLELLRGEHDFRGFRSSMCTARRTRLTLEQATMRQAGELIAFDFKCRSFLHHMIRFLVGTLVSMGEGKLDRRRLLRIRDEFDRPALVLCAPPEGLCLMGVGYTEAECEALRAADPEAPGF